ncbi:hypothetical protein FOZ63_019060, partial [Perkinsus olseni]
MISQPLAEKGEDEESSSSRMATARYRGKQATKRLKSKSRYIPPYKRKELAELAAADGQSLAPQRGTRHLEESFSPTTLKGRSAWGQGSLVNRESHQDRRFSSSGYADDRTSFGRRRFGSASFVERGSSFSSLSGFARRK